MGWQLQLLLSLATGAVPVLVGDGHLPLAGAIPEAQWSRVLVRVARPRLQQLPIILNSISAAHIVEMRRQVSVILAHRSCSAKKSVPHD